MLTPNGRVRLQLGVPTGGPKDWKITLRAEDADSGEVLFVVDIDPATWVQINRGLVHVEDAFIGRHLDRVGKTLQTATVNIPRDVMNGLSYADQEDEAKRWAGRHCASPYAPWADDGGPDEWRVTRHNYGWAVHAERWVDP